MGEVQRKPVTSTTSMEVKHGSQGKISNIICCSSTILLQWQHNLETGWCTIFGLAFNRLPYLGSLKNKRQWNYCQRVSFTASIKHILPCPHLILLEANFLKLWCKKCLILAFCQYDKQCPHSPTNSNVINMSLYTGYTWLYEIISILFVLYLPKCNTN